MTTRLPDRTRSYAILIGTSAYDPPTASLYPALRELPSVRHNLAAMRAFLTDPALGGFAPERCITIHDPRNVRRLNRTLREYAVAAEDTFFVYFAGHGRTDQRNHLHLTLSDTDPGDLALTALAFERLREVYTDTCRAVNKVVILDCCFSGRAIPDLSGDDAGGVAIAGTYVLTATSGTERAMAPTGATHTAFTGHLLDLVHRGIPNGPPYLTYAGIFPHLKNALLDHGYPEPQQRFYGTIGNLALSRNPAAPNDPRRAPHGVRHPAPPPRPRPTATPLRPPPDRAESPSTRSAASRSAAPQPHPAPSDRSRSRGERPAERLRRATIALFAVALIGAGFVLVPKVNLSLPDWDIPIPFLQSRTPVHVTATGPAPWTIEGYGWRYTVESVERTTSDWRFEQNPSITVTAYVERTENQDFSRMFFTFRDQNSGAALEAVPFEGGGDSQPPLHQRSRLVHVVNDTDPLATKLTITLHDFYWPDGRDLVLSDIPSPSSE